ncbi:hypothetical protein L9F63_000544, partial [Diploptera punctata]
VVLITSILSVLIALSQAQFSIRNFTQGMKLRTERNAIFDPPFQGTFYLPADVREGYSKQRGDRNVQQEFHPLCEVMTRRVELSDGQYEYRPPYYHEKICQAFQEDETSITNNNQMCTFQCVQRTNTMYLTRRRYDSNCWETFTKTVASACECMLPERRYASSG